MRALLAIAYGLAAGVCLGLTLEACGLPNWVIAPAVVIACEVVYQLARRSS